MPGSTTHYSGQQFYYDNMGRLVQWTNPTDTTGDAAWTVSGDDISAGWVSTTRTCDWQGRPLKTTYVDNSTTELSYGGCGCAGGEVTTSRDQRGRLKKSYRDVLGRLSKVEELNYDSTVYSTAVYDYDEGSQIRASGTTRGPPLRAARSKSALSVTTTSGGSPRARPRSRGRRSTAISPMTPLTG